MAATDRARAARRIAGMARVAAGAVLAFGALSLAAGLDLGWLRALPETGRLVQWTSPPTGLGMAVGYLLRAAGHPHAFDPAVTAARLLGAALLAVTTAALLARAGQAAGDTGTAGGTGSARTARNRPARTGQPVVIARRRVVAACGAAFAALALLSPVFYPWYALTAIAILAVGVTDPGWRRRLAATVVALSLLVLPNGLGLAVPTKAPGALLSLLLVGAAGVIAVRWTHRRRAS